MKIFILIFALAFLFHGYVIASNQGMKFVLGRQGTGYIVVAGDEDPLIVTTIPAIYEGKPVVAIGDRAFANCSKLESITIPDSVVSIGKESFMGCTEIVSIKIPDSVQYIGDSAFECPISSRNKLERIFLGKV